MAKQQRYDSTTQKQSTDALNRLWYYQQYKNMQLLSGESAQEIRRLIFTDNLSDKIILPEDTIYHGDDEATTLYHLGAVTKPITIELPEVQGK